MTTGESLSVLGGESVFVETQLFAKTLLAGAALRWAASASSLWLYEKNTLTIWRLN